MYENSDARRRVLDRLRAGAATVQELACEAQVVPVTMRAHLRALQRQGLVGASDERGHVGRPRRRFFLTDQGRARFPNRSAELTADLLEALRLVTGQRGVRQILSIAAARYADRHAVAGASLRDRVAAVAEVLDQEGGLARWEQDGDSFRLLDLSCPYAMLTGGDDTVCRYHTQAVAGMLGQPVRLESSIAEGAGLCAFATEGRLAAHPAAVRTFSDGRLAPGRAAEEWGRPGPAEQRDA